MQVARFERDTQTVAAFNKYQQVSADATTQMVSLFSLSCILSETSHHWYSSHLQDRIGCYITNRTDKIIIPGPYETADQYHARIMEKVSIGCGTNASLTVLRMCDIVTEKKSQIYRNWHLVHTRYTHRNASWICTKQFIK